MTIATRPFAIFGKEKNRILPDRSGIREQAVEGWLCAGTAGAGGDPRRHLEGIELRLLVALPEFSAGKSETTSATEYDRLAVAYEMLLAQLQCGLDDQREVRVKS